MNKKLKDRGETKSLDDLIEKDGSLKIGSIKRTRSPRNNFPFVPAREGKENPLGLYLDKFDCRILNGIQQYGFKPIPEFCKLIKIKQWKFYERFRNSPGLGEGMRLLADTSRAYAYPSHMQTLNEKFSESPQWALIYCRVSGLIDEPTLKVGRKEEDTEHAFLTQKQIEDLIRGNR
jgi:hypothetical protein